MAIAHPNNPGVLTTTATTIFIWVMRCHVYDTSCGYKYKGKYPIIPTGSVD